MQSLISNGCVKKFYSYVVLIRNNIRCIKKSKKWNYIWKNVINELMLILEKLQKQISSNLDYGWWRKTWYKIWMQIKRGKAYYSSLAMSVCLPGSHLSVGQATVIIFYIGIWRRRVGPTLFFLNWNLLPSNIIPHKQHRKIRKNTNNS
jgi:hypothetical protein